MENKWTNMVLYHKDNYVVFLFRFGNFLFLIYVSLFIKVFCIFINFDKF